MDTNPPGLSPSRPTQIIEGPLVGITNQPDSSDGRRSHHRYPIDLGINCRVLRSKRIVLGKIRDISSGGIRFISPEVLAPGTRVELAIDWPVLLDHTCRLQLKCRGRV